MSKRKHKKKRNLASKGGGAKPVAAVAASPAVSASAPEGDAITEVEAVASAQPAAKAATKPVGEWDYVGRDVKRIGWLAAACIATLLALLYLFNHTGLGSSIYSLIKI